MQSHRVRRLPDLLASALFLASCVGRIDGEGEVPSEAGDSTNPTPSGGQGSTRPSLAGQPSATARQPPVGGPTAPPGAMPLRRLTKLELANTVRELLSVTDVQAPASLPPDVLADNGFLVGGSTSRVEAEIFMAWTGRLATAAVAQPDRILPCQPIPTGRTAEDSCAQKFIAEFGLRAFRRPLTKGEIDELFGYYRDQLRSALGYDFVTSVRGLIQLMLQSPRFLYHWEHSPDPAVVTAGRIQLGPYAIASRLSSMFWASMPDAQLLAAAANNQLATREQIEAQARRMLSNANARNVVENFHLQWLEIGDLPARTKAPKYGFTAQLGQSMLSETRRFVSSVFEGDGRFETLLTSPVTFLDSAPLAKLYGYAGFTGTAAKQVTLAKEQRSGLLTQASFLTAQSLESELNPIKRGKTIVERLLCLSIPPPPEDVPAAPIPSTGVSTRERLASHSKNPCAQACHGLFDPPGLAFENYDGIGAFRSMDGGRPVDASATIKFPSGDTRAVQGAVELTKVLAQSEEVRSCVVRQWFRYSIGRREVAGDEPSLRASQQAFSAGQQDLRELVIALASSPAFAYRSPSVGEVVK